MKKKLLALTLCAALALGLAACSTPTPPATPSATPGTAALYKAGTYTGTSEGFHGEMTVEVILDDNSIAEIKVLSHGETEGVGTVALEKLPATIVEKQSLAVDTISGCTVSSEALVEAVKAALTTAGADVEALMTPAAQDAPTGENVEMTADVVVVGGGGAGLAAALSAAENGASVIVLEKTGMLGGTTILSGAYYSSGRQDISDKAEMNDKMRQDVADILAMEPRNDDMAAWQDAVREQYAAYETSGATYMFDSEEYHMLQVYADGRFAGDTALIQRLCTISGECYDWLGGYGLNWSEDIIGAKASDSGTVMLDAQRARRNKSDGSERHSAQLIHIMEENALAAATPAQILTEVSGKELIVTDGAVTGVIAEGADGSTYRITANKGVILATGGFAANPEMCQSYNTLYPAIPAGTATTNSLAATGDGITMALSADAALLDMELMQFWPHTNPGTGSTKGYVSPYTNLLVNNQGKRFADETLSDDELAWAMLEQPDNVVFILSDANNSVIDAEGKNSNGIPVETLIEEGTVLKADTLEELAGLMGVDAAALAATVERFNSACDAGVDSEFGRANLPVTLKLTTAPYYATRTAPAMHHTMGGVHIDTQARALDSAGNVIPGLYAAGEVAGGFSGENRVSGNAILEAIAEGKIAGEDAAAR